MSTIPEPDVSKDANPVRAFRRYMRDNFGARPATALDEHALYLLEIYCDDMLERGNAFSVTFPFTNWRT